MRAVILFGAVLTLGGCVSATVEQVRQGSTTMTAADSVVLLGRRQNVGYETEADFVSCVGNQLDSQDLRVIPEQEFVDSLFPWFEPRVAPLTTEELPKILGKPIIANKLKSQGIKYLVWIDGHLAEKGSGAFTCGVSLTGAACFGFTAFEKDASYEATVWDIHTLSTVGKISSDANGTTYVPWVIAPIPFVARVQGSACDGMADQLRGFLQGEEAS